MIAGVMKYFGMGYREALYEISYNNLVMLSATIPEYDSGDGKENEVTIDGSDPSNNAMIMHLLG